MNWKDLAMMAAIIGASTGGGYYDGGVDGALRHFLIAVCGTGVACCIGHLLTKGR